MDYAASIIQADNNTEIITNNNGRIVLPKCTWRSSRFCWYSPHTACPSNGHLDCRNQSDLVQSLVDDKMYQIEMKAIGKDQFTMCFKDVLPIVALIISRSRGASNKTLNDLAKEVGLKSPNSIHQYEAGKHDTGVSRLNALLNAMGFDLSITVSRRDNSNVA